MVCTADIGALLVVCTADIGALETKLKLARMKL